MSLAARLLTRERAGRRSKDAPEVLGTLTPKRRPCAI